MGIWNARVFCPGCGAKIHTQGAGYRTGKVCPYCGVALTGKVIGKRAESAEQAETKQRRDQVWNHLRKFEGMSFLEARREMIRLHEEGKL